MKLQTIGVLCSLGILFAPFSQSASTCNNCHNIDCSQSFGIYNQCYRNCCPSSPCESNCHSNECRSNCQMTACQSNCQTSECRSICQVSQCQSNCQSNLCKLNCELNQNRCQSGSCNDYPIASQCSGNVPCDTPRPAPCSAAAPCSATTSPCPSSKVYVNGTSCASPNITVNATPNISLPKITVNIHQGAINVGPIHVNNNFTLRCGNGTVPCSRPPTIVRVPHYHPPPPHPPPRIIYRWIPRPVAQQPCCQYNENRCVNNVCYPQQVTGCGVQCLQAPAQPTQQCPWYGCQNGAALAPCSTDACQPPLAPNGQPPVPVYGGGSYDASYNQQQPQVLPQPVPETSTAYPQPLPEALPQPYPEPYPQPVPQPQPHPQPVPQPYPQPQPLPEHYPQPQPLPHPYPQPQPLPHPYQPPQPLPQPYQPPQPLPQPYQPPQPLPQPHQPPQPLPQPHSQSYPYQPQQQQTYPLTWEALPSNCIRIQQWPYFSCQSEPYLDHAYYQGSYAAAFPGIYAPSYPEYKDEVEVTTNKTVKSNATEGVEPVWSSFPPTPPMRIIPKPESEESSSEESSEEYEDDQPESARSNSTIT